MTLAELEEMALSRNPTLAQAAAQIAAARADMCSGGPLSESGGRLHGQRNR